MHLIIQICYPKYYQQSSNHRPHSRTPTSSSSLDRPQQKSFYIINLPIQDPQTHGHHARNLGGPSICIQSSLKRGRGPKQKAKEHKEEELPARTQSSERARSAGREGRKEEGQVLWRTVGCGPAAGRLAAGLPPGTSEAPEYISLFCPLSRSLLVRAARVHGIARAFSRPAPPVEEYFRDADAASELFLRSFRFRAVRF